MHDSELTAILNAGLIVVVALFVHDWAMSYRHRRRETAARKKLVDQREPKHEIN